MTYTKQGDVIGKYRAVRALYYIDELYDLKDNVVCIDNKISSTAFVKHWHFITVCKMIRQRRIWIVELIKT